MDGSAGGVIPNYNELDYSALNFSDHGTRDEFANWNFRRCPYMYTYCVATVHILYSIWSSTYTQCRG